MSTSIDKVVRVEVVPCALCGSCETEYYDSGTDLEYRTCEMVFEFVRCAACGHVYLNPRPTITSAHLIYPSNYYTLNEGSAWVDCILARIKDRILYRRVEAMVLALPRGARWLEVGAGDGALSRAVRRRRPDMAITVLDLRFSETTRTSLETEGIDVTEGPLENATLSGSFDAVVMNQLIEHLWEPGNALKRLRSHLAEGAIVSITTPNLDGYDRHWFGPGLWGGYYFPRHLHLFSITSLCCLLESSGYRVLHKGSLVAPLVWIRSVFNTLSQRGNTWRKLFTDGNLIALAIFTTMDLVAIALGRVTSNQQVIASPC